MKTIVISLSSKTIAMRECMIGILEYANTQRDWELTILPDTRGETTQGLTPRFVREAIRNGVAGFISGHTIRSAGFDALVSSGLPVVLNNAPSGWNRPKNAPITLIHNDDITIGRTGSRHFLSIGNFRSYGFVREEENNYWGTYRCRGFDLELSRHGIRPHVFDPAQTSLADWLLGLSDNPSVEENNQITQKTLGLSPEAVENLAKVARMRRYPNLSSFHTEFGKQVLGTALNCLLSSEALIGIARSIYEFYDASAKMREVENLTVEDLCQMDTNYADYDCTETFKNYRLARLDLNESLLAITNDRMEFLKATQAQHIVDDFYIRLEEAEKISEQQENQAENEWVKTFAEAEKESPDYSEREGLDEDYGSDETKGN